MDISNALLELNKSNILRFVSAKDIYNYYLGGKLVYGRAFSSPFREDKNPSFVISKQTDYFNDYATGENGDCFTFVKHVYGGHMNFYEVLKQIAMDLNIANNFIIMDRSVRPTQIKEVRNISRRGSFQGDFELKVKVRPYQKHDLEYWNSYGIDERHLRMAKIFSISHYFINGSQQKAARHAYVYVELKDGKESYKVYQPFSKYMKWINNNDYSVWELWTLLPKTYDKAIITSSRKDAISIIKNFRVPSTSFQAESIVPKAHVVDEMKSRFKKVYLFYDNDFDNPDNPGQTLAKKRIDQFGFTNLYIPEKYGCKDFSDLVYDYGVKNACEILTQIMKEADEFNKYKPLSAS
jgi:hypothetical protein